MEQPKDLKRSEVVRSPIERSANYEGNATELLLNRVSNSTIREQIIRTLLEGELHEYEDFLSAVPDGEFRDFIRGPSGTYYARDRFRSAPTREEIIRALDERIAAVSASTPVSFNPEDSVSEDSIAVLGEVPGLGRLNARQLSIAEAHEKGHTIRPYRGFFFDQRFEPGFDTSHTVIDPEEPMTQYELSHIEDIPEDVSPLECVRSRIISYLFSATEIAERMSQLKNYFGMRGSERFTKEHLDYVRIHYVVDTGLDNHMTHFFQAITTETEETFLDLINSMGI